MGKEHEISSRPRVMLLSAWYPSDISPISGVFIQDQARALSAKFDVAVLNPQLIGWRQAAKGQIGPASEATERAGLMLFRERILPPLPRVSVLADWSYNKAADRGFQKVQAGWGRPDIIHAHVVIPAGRAAVRLGKRFSIPVVVTEHSSFFPAQLRSGYKRRQIEETLRGVKHTIAVSPTILEQIRSCDQGSAASIIGNLVRTEFFVPSEGAEKESSGRLTRFLTVALLRRVKGVAYLLEAAQLLVQRGFVSFELVIAGDGPQRTSLERKARELQIAGRCRFLGILSPTEVKERMQQCDVFVLPSLYETFGIVLGEAMACGKPVIATRCGGPEFVVTPDAGILVHPADPVALADAMERFICGKVKYDPAVVRQRVVERFGVEAFLRNISEVYQQVWSSPGRGLCE